MTKEFPIANIQCVANPPETEIGRNPTNTEFPTLANEFPYAQSVCHGQLLRSFLGYLLIRLWEDVGVEQIRNLVKNRRRWSGFAMSCFSLFFQDFKERLVIGYPIRIIELSRSDLDQAGDSGARCGSVMSGKSFIHLLLIIWREALHKFHEAYSCRAHSERLLTYAYRVNAILVFPFPPGTARPRQLSRTIGQYAGWQLIPPHCFLSNSSTS